MEKYDCENLIKILKALQNIDDREILLSTLEMLVEELEEHVLNLNSKHDSKI